MKRVESQKLQIEQAKVCEWPGTQRHRCSKIEEQQAAVNEEIAQLTKRSEPRYNLGSEEMRRGARRASTPGVNRNRKSAAGA